MSNQGVPLKLEHRIPLPHGHGSVRVASENHGSGNPSFFLNDPAQPEAALRPTLGSKPSGSIGCRIEFDSSLLTLVVAVVSRPPLVELGSNATLRPGDQSHVRDRLYHFQLHAKMTPPSLWDFGDLLFA